MQADPTRLLQIVGNLLTNAVKYTPPGGRIEVERRARRESARVYVRDSGVGLAPEMMPRVFQLFAQMHADLARQQGRAGHRTGAW